MDATDQRLLDLLEADARASVTALSEQLRLARSTVQDRIARLEASGEIRGYTIRRADPRAARLIRAHVMLSVDPKLQDRVVADLKALPELKRLATVSGEFDLIAELAADTTERLDTLLDHIGRLKGIQRTMSSIVLSVKAER
ncbi:MAG: Lrp/AsnC family transcriptional regulator [Alphaproteobacteria bacterium]|nr:Lrp/AsnC family transcriptional regulator [Alphaproteobacteria bacterium]